MNLAIRPMLESEADAARALWRAALPGDGDPSDAPEAVLAFLRRNPGTCLAAFLDDRMVGTVLGGFDGRRGYIYHLAVLPELQGRGIGARLLDAVATALRDLGVPKAHLFVFEHNTAAHAFYEREGWAHRTDIRIYSKGLTWGEDR